MFFFFFFLSSAAEVISVRHILLFFQFTKTNLCQNKIVPLHKNNHFLVISLCSRKDEDENLIFILGPLKQLQCSSAGHSVHLKVRNSLTADCWMKLISPRLHIGGITGVLL